MTLHMHDLFSTEDFAAARAAKLINERDDRAGLRVLNYSDAALFTAGAWDNPAVRACRGLIVDDAGRVHARPWSKFFNHGQAEAPQIEDPKHAEFTEQVKLEPFRRAMAAHTPDVWFTNLRKGQTALRDSLDILSLSKDGVLKVSPFYYWSDTQLDAYLKQNNLPNEHKYFDPTKVLENRECGLHT